MSDPRFDPSRRRFVRTVAGGTIVAALPLSGCGTFAAGIPDSANAAWRPSGASSDPRVRALAWAILAPNPHNRQPWLIELAGDDEIVVRVDTERLLPHTDPFGRQILIGTGAMLGLLDIAAAADGFATETTLFENGVFDAAIDARPLARVRLLPQDGPRATALFERIPERRTVRDAYDPSRPPPVAFGEALAALSAASGTRARVVARDEEAELAGELASLARLGWAIELTNAETYLESAELLRIGAREIDRHRDGISITSPMLVALERFGLFDRSAVPGADSSVIRRQLDDFAAVVESTPAFYVLSSGDNTRETQLRVGRAYVRAHLTATAHGMVMHPLSQVLQEFPEMREAYASARRLLLPDGADDAGTVQMLCRVGYLPDGERMPAASPRRGLQAHLRA